MKKTDIGLIIGVIAIVVVVFIAGSVNASKSDIELPLVLAGDPGVNDITYAEYEQYIENDDAFLVVIKQDGCIHCENFLPIVEEVVGEYQIPVMVLNLTNLNMDDYTSLSSSNRYLKTKKWGTPTTLLLKGSTVVDSIGGETDKDTFVKFIKENVKISE